MAMMTFKRSMSIALTMMLTRTLRGDNDADVKITRTSVMTSLSTLGAFSTVILE